MRRTILIGLGAAAMGSLGAITPSLARPAGAPAAQARTATFAIANMTCPTCPITVKAAMQRVAGVRSVSVDFKAKTATVVFDPARTNTASIAAASTDAGYPAKPAG